MDITNPGFSLFISSFLEIEPLIYLHAVIRLTLTLAHFAFWNCITEKWMKDTADVYFRDTFGLRRVLIMLWLCPHQKLYVKGLDCDNFESEEKFIA